MGRRDSFVSHAVVLPGELNLMTAGRGVFHSEVSTASTTLLHGVQLWLALPDRARDVPRGFTRHVPEPLRRDGWTARVFLGSLAGSASPVPTFSPLLGAELTLDPMALVTLPVDPAFEHAVLVDLGPVGLDDTELKPAELGYVAPGADRLVLANPGDDQARILLLGGEPFGEDIVMWWNFVGRSHEEVAAFREAWQRGSARFGVVEGYAGEPQRLPAPPLPNVRIKPRQSPPGPGDPSAWG